MRSPGKHVALAAAACTLLTLTAFPRYAPAHAGPLAGAIARAGKAGDSRSLQAQQAPRLTTFTSTRLGISFVYQSGPYSNGERVRVKAVGNRVYVYAGMPYLQGQWVEVRAKRRGQRLQDAIYAQLLKGYSRANCVVRAAYAHYRMSTYTVMSIVPTHMGPGGNFGTTCPQAYTTSNGISYFLADSRHPSIYLYFSIGQYPIDAGAGKTWQDTIRFLP